MQVRLDPTQLRAPARRRKGRFRVATVRASGAAPDTARHRRPGGPEDRALYQCDCGRSFVAAVTATVGCPSCGAAQPW
jgi:hypothetical protein